MDFSTGVETALRAAVAERVGESRFGLWFGEGVRLGVDGDALEVGVPNAFFREWIQGHFAGSLAEAAEAVAGRPLRLTFRLDDEAEPKLGTVVRPPEPDDRRSLAPTPAPPSPPDRPRAQGPGRPARRLEEFITGPGTRLANAAASEMAQAAGATFNPLVIHGGIGLGKTHLLEGVAVALRARHPGRKVVHLTAEAFTNSFIEAMRTGTLASFRSRYRSADALLVDQLHARRQPVDLPDQMAADAVLQVEELFERPVEMPGHVRDFLEELVSPVRHDPPGDWPARSTANSWRHDGQVTAAWLWPSALIRR